jgi:hypothetical protein
MGVTPLRRYYRPIRLPLAFGGFPGVPVIPPTLLRSPSTGTRRVSPVAQHVLVTMPSIITPPEFSIASVVSR